MEEALLFVDGKEGVSLAASRETSNGPDWKDCQVVMREIQKDLDARVELTTVLFPSSKGEGMTVKATAYPYLRTQMEQRQSVSLSVNLTTCSPSLVSAAIFRLLLALDYEISKAWATRQAT
jgi:hypothetical protein